MRLGAWLSTISPMPPAALSPEQQAAARVVAWGIADLLALLDGAHDGMGFQGIRAFLATCDKVSAKVRTYLMTIGTTDHAETTIVSPIASLVEELPIGDRDFATLVAAVLVQMTSDSAARVLSLFPSDFQTQAAIDAWYMPDALEGMSCDLVGILQRMDGEASKAIVEALERFAPEVSESITGKLFSFDDMRQLDDRSIQRLLREVETKDLALALKAAPVDLQERVTSNMSTRAAQLLKDDIECLAPVTRDDVEKVRGKVARIIARLVAIGEIRIFQDLSQVI